MSAGNDERNPLRDEAAFAEQHFTPLMTNTVLRVVKGNKEVGFKPHATASLFKTADHLFLITAAHVLKNESDLWIENAARQKRISIPGQRFINEEDDIGFVDLSPAAQQAMGGLGALSTASISMVIPPAARFLLFGFPVELNNRSEKNGLGYLCSRYQGSTVGIDYDPAIHLLLTYDTSFSSGVDGTPVGLPESLKGISGCPVWHFAPRGAQPRLDLAGIETATIPVEGKAYIKIIKVTKWTAVLASIVEAFPDLLSS